jgi:hypothetical protein
VKCPRQDCEYQDECPCQDCEYQDECPFAHNRPAVCHRRPEPSEERTFDDRLREAAEITGNQDD